MKKKELLLSVLAMVSIISMSSFGRVKKGFNKTTHNNNNNLISGYEAFFEKYFKQQPELYQKLAQGQAPKTLFLACCDSRIDPVILTSAQPGDLFVVRNIANFVPKYTTSLLESEAITAIELAVVAMPIQQIIVLGHQHCTGVKTVATSCRTTQPSELGVMPLVWEEQCERLNDALQEKYSKNNATQFEKTNITISCQDLLTYPFIKKRVNQGKLMVQGWYFSLETGGIEVYNPENDTFTPLIKSISKHTK